ncbi:hypothetical protein, partial [Clostridium sp.]|uniref:hypothetical protein n=1 Tax=Clostridium sp. TaxID=1506 RepID=UPI003F3E795A
LFLILSGIIPIIMIVIGVLYKLHLNKNINKAYDLLTPPSILITYLLDNKHDLKYKNNYIYFSNKKRSSAWIRFGFITLIFSITIFILHKDNIFNTFIVLLKLQIIILISISMLIDYILK